VVNRPALPETPVAETLAVRLELNRLVLKLVAYWAWW